MDTIKFWKHWSKPEKLFLYFSGIVLFTALTVYVYRFYLGEDTTKWEVVTETETIEREAYAFQWNAENHTVETNDYVNRSYFQAAEIAFDTIYSKLYFGFLLFSLVLALVSASFIKKSNAYVLFMAALGALLFFFSFDVIEVFNRQDHVVFGGVFLLFSGVNFCLNFYRNNSLGIWVRFGVNMVMVLSVFTTIILFSHAPEPVLYLTNYVSKSVSVIVLLFSCLVGYDVLASFFYLISSSKSVNPMSTIINFLVVSALLLGSLVIFFLKEINYITWELTLLNPFILLFLSTIVGIWGHSRRRVFYEGVLEFRRGGLLLYIAGAIAAISSVSYAFQTSNTGMIMSYKQMIVYGHLTMGIAFLLYILKNFWGDILEHKLVWPVLYSPKYLTHRYVRFIGLSSVILLVVINKNVPVKKWKSGLLTYKADAYDYTGQKLLAKENYHVAYAINPGNYKAQFSDAMNELADQNIDESLDIFDYMLRTHDAPVVAFVNMANIYALKEEYFNSVFILKKGIARYPENGYLMNNLGYFLEKEETFTPVFSTYKKAAEYLPEDYKSVPFGNNLAFATRFNEGGTVLDSMLNETAYDENLIVKGNKQAASNKTQQIWLNEYKRVSDLTPANVSYMANSINGEKIPDSTVQKEFEYAQNELGATETIAHALSIEKAKKGEFYAFDTLSAHVIQNAGNYVFGYYYFQQGKACLSMGLEENAFDRFEKSIKYQPIKPQNEAPLYVAKLELLRGDTMMANRLIDKLLAFGLYKKEAEALRIALNIDNVTQFNAIENDKVRSVVLNYAPVFNSIVSINALKIDELSSEERVLVFKRAIATKDQELITRIYNSLGFEVNKSLIVDMYLSYLSEVNNSVVFVDAYEKNETIISGKNKALYQAVYWQYKGDNKLAKRAYEELWSSNAHNTSYGEHYVSFLKDNQKDRQAAYILIQKLLLVNDYWLPYQKLYIELALWNGDFVFARESLQEIADRGMMNQQELDLYLIEFEEIKKQALEEIDNSW